MLDQLASMRGQNDDTANQQQHLCIDDKPVPPLYSVPAAGGTTANVCCLHGVQTRPTPFGYAPPPPPQPIARKPELMGAGVASTVSGLLSRLDPRKWFSSSKAKEKLYSGQIRPVAPPRHFKPSVSYEQQVSNGTQAAGRQRDIVQEQGQQSWLVKLWNYLPSFGKKAENVETESPNSPISVRRILKVTNMPAAEERGGDAINGLRHAVEPHYPVTLPQDQDPYKPSMIVRTVTVSNNIPPPPSGPPRPNIGQVRTRTKPNQIPPPLMPDDARANTSGPFGVQRRVIWSTDDIQQPPQPHAATTVQVQRQRKQLRRTATTESRTAVSPNRYEPEDNRKSVRDIKRQWPPPSNASGAEIVRDLVFSHVAPGDLSSKTMSNGDAAFNYDVYRPSAKAETMTRSMYEERRRDYSGGRDHSEPHGSYEDGATSPQKFRELSQELNSNSSAGKGIEMFVRRRQRVENYEAEEQQQSRPVLPSAVQRMVPVAAPRRRVSANEVVDSVVEAASRKEHQWQRQPVSLPLRPESSHTIRREPEMVISPSPPAPSWRTHGTHERFFSPQPFSPSGGYAPARERLFTPPPRIHEPKAQQQAFRSASVLGDRLEKKELVDWSSGPDTTTTVISSDTPTAKRTMTTSTYASSHGSHYTKTSVYNNQPRTWKSYSEAYQPAR